MNVEDTSLQSNVVIDLRHVSKAYGIPYSFNLQRLSKFLRGDSRAFRRNDMAMVLKDINLNVRRGELLGIIGRNGAGKSTLLKVLAGVSKATSGAVQVQGSIFPMIELNAGMNPRFTGRENIYLLGAIMNISRSQMDARMNDIEQFCDLGEFFDKPVREYSSGMPGRLGFAVAVHADASIVLVDEVLSVGDINFRNRCTAKMEELRDSGKTLILVSHNMTAVNALCTRTIVLDSGEIKFNGPTSSAIQFYSEMMQSIAQRKLQKSIKSAPKKTKSEVCDFWGVKVLNGRDEEMPVFDSNKVMKIVCTISARRELDEAIVGVEIKDKDKLVLVNEDWLVRLSKENVVRLITFEFPRGIPLKSGQYELHVFVKDKFGERIIASQEQLLHVTAPKRTGKGIIAPRFKVRVADGDLSASSSKPSFAALSSQD